MKKYLIDKDGILNSTIEADKIEFNKPTGITLFFRKNTENTTVFRLCAVVPPGYLITEIAPPQAPIIETCGGFCKCAIRSVEELKTGVKICLGCYKQVKSE